MHSACAVSVGASEAYAVPRLQPGLLEVNTYLGWFGGFSRMVQIQSAALSAIARIPGSRTLLDRATGALVRGSTGGPAAEERARHGSYVVGTAYDAAGRELAEVRLEGVDGYTFTARFLAWAAQRAASEGFNGTGALGPVDAFGLEQLEEGVAIGGITRTSN